MNNKDGITKRRTQERIESLLKTLSLTLTPTTLLSILSAALPTLSPSPAVSSVKGGMSTLSPGLSLWSVLFASYLPLWHFLPVSSCSPFLL